MQHLRENIFFLLTYFPRDNTLALSYHIIKNMALKLPEFITLDFLQGIFSKHFNGSGYVKVEHFWGEFATKRGDNYASDMYRINVDYEYSDCKRRKPIILKVSLLGCSTHFMVF